MRSPFMIGLIVVFILLFIHDAVNDHRDYKIAMAKIKNRGRRNNDRQDEEL